MQPDLGADNPVIHGNNVQEVGDPRKPGQDQSNGMHTGISLEPIGSGGVQEESDGRRGQISGEEENQGKLRGVWGYNYVVLYVSLHGEVRWYSPATEQGGRTLMGGFRRPMWCHFREF